MMSLRSRLSRTARLALSRTLNLAASVALSLSAALPVAAQTQLLVDTTDDTQTYSAATSLAECTDGVADGDCTLREAIQVANANDGSGATTDLDVIGFEVTQANGASATGLATIQPSSALPTILDENVVIDGYTQTGASPNTLAVGTNAMLRIELDGQNAGDVNGLVVTGPGVTLRGLVVNRFERAGIRVGAGGQGAVVEGSYIGTDATGTIDLGNDRNGVFVVNAPGARIGTDGDGVADAAEQNVIAGNGGSGVRIEGTPASGTIVAGNYIGTDATGTASLGNGVAGVRVIDAPGARIGTDGDGVADDAERNVIAGNGIEGVAIGGPGASGAVVAGNHIGTDVTGTIDLGNDQQGVAVFNAPGVRIGTDGDGVADDAERNVIAGNGTNGVLIGGPGAVVAGNYIGTDATGTIDLGNSQGGVAVIDAPGVRIGTNGDDVADDAERNVIAGNGREGIRIKGIATTGTVVAGNYIGTNATGTARLRNDWQGVFVDGSPDTRIGTNGDGVADAAERNVIAGNRFRGIHILGSGASGTVVAGNYIGTDATGTAGLGNDERGVLVNGSPDTRIGTNGDGVADTAERNVISSNGRDGVMIAGTSSGTVVAGNYIGTDATGTIDLGNGLRGVEVLFFSDTRIGTDGDGVADTAERNVIAGNGREGIRTSASGTVVAGNYIGTDATGTASLGNDLSGVLVDGGRDARIGTDGDGIADEAEVNLIAHNRASGVTVQGSAAGSAVLGNTIRDNGGLGIDLSGGAENADGVTANDPDDADDGPSGLQNYPVIIAAAETASGADVSFTLDSAPSTRFRVELFASDTADPSGFGEGTRLLGAVNVATDADGDATGALSVTGVANGDFISATATPITSASGTTPVTFGGTSEFSAASGVFPAASFAEAAIVGVEGASIEVRVTLSPPAQGGETVDVVLASSAPASATDSDLSGFASETITFATGDTDATITIDIAEDGRAEDIETFTLALQNPTGLALGAPSETVLTVDPSAVGVRFDVVQRVVSEGDGSFVLSVLLSDVPPGDAIADVVLTEGDPADLDGFTSERLVLASAPGAGQVYTVEVPITDDATVETDEQFIFELRLIDAGQTDDGNPSVTLTAPSSTARIVVDDDGALVTVTVPARDEDGDSEEDGGPRAFAVPVGGLTAAEVATVAGTDSVYVVGPDGALVAVPTGAPLAAGAVVVADVAPGADLTFSGSEAPSPVPAAVQGVGDGQRALIAVGNPTGEAISLDALSVEDADLADVVLVFDAEAGSFRPVSLAGLADSSDGGEPVLGPFKVVVAQAILTDAAVRVTAALDTSAPAASGPLLSEQPFTPTDGETAVVLSVQAATAATTTASAAASGVAPARPSDTVVLRFGVGADELDPFDGLDLPTPFGITATLVGPEAARFAALSAGDLERGPVTIPLALSVADAGAYQIALGAPLADLGPRPVLVELLDGTASTSLTADAPATVTIGASEDLTGRFALRVSLGNAVSTDDDALRPALAVWPNPSTGPLAVSLTLPEAGAVRVAVYDALGREVARLHDGPAGAGELRTDLPSGRLAPGRYLLRADGPGLAEVRSLTIVR